jgi:hypothetical protein
MERGGLQILPLKLWSHYSLNVPVDTVNLISASNYLSQMLNGQIELTSMRKNRIEREYGQDSHLLTDQDYEKLNLEYFCSTVSSSDIPDVRIKLRQEVNNKKQMFKDFSHSIVVTQAYSPDLEMCSLIDKIKLLINNVPATQSGLLFLKFVSSTCPFLGKHKGDCNRLKRLLKIERYKDQKIKSLIRLLQMQSLEIDVYKLQGYGLHLGEIIDILGDTISSPVMTCVSEKFVGYLKNISLKQLLNSPELLKRSLKKLNLHEVLSSVMLSVEQCYISTDIYRKLGRW